MTTKKANGIIKTNFQKSINKLRLNDFLYFLEQLLRFQLFLYPSLTPDLKQFQLIKSQMGNETQKPQSKQNHTEQDIKISHQRFERYKYIPSTDLLQITIDVPEQKQMKTWEKDVTSSINGFENKDSLLLPIRHEYQPKGWCGNTGSAKIFYENFPYLFSEEIENRISMNKYFEEEELWYLLYSLVGCAKDFSKIDRKIGDVRPHNIFINEEGQIKIANAYSWPYQKTNFEKSAFEKQKTYVSPEQMSLIEKGNHENTTNKVASQSFSIGLTLLESGLLFHAEELYNLESRTFNQQKLGQLINQWLNLQFPNSENTGMTSYSNLLKNIVASLCHIDPQHRLTSIEVLDALIPYENQIMNLKYFDKKQIEMNHFQEALRQSQQQPIQQRVEQVYYSHPVNTIPPQQILTSSQQGYQQQVFAVPPQTYKVGGSQAYGPPPVQIIRQPQYAEPVRINQSGFNSVPVRAPVDSQTGYRQVFTRYAANQPEHEIPASNYIPSNQPFQKYPQQPIQTQIYQTSQQSFTQSYSTPQNNTFNVPVPFVGTTQFNTANQYATTSTFQKNQFISNTAPQYQSSVPQSYVSSSNASDFLKKIDQQLQNSRNLYPS